MSELSDYKRCVEAPMIAAYCGRIKLLDAALEAALSERDALRRALIDTGRIIGAGLSEDVSSEFLALIPEEARWRVTALEKALALVPSALNNAFMAGGEEREGGSASRQERLMKSVDELRSMLRSLSPKLGEEKR
jgi:hypothetical protein